MLAHGCKIQELCHESRFHPSLLCLGCQYVLRAQVFLIMTAELTMQTRRAMGSTIILLLGAGLAAHIRVVQLQLHYLAFLKAKNLD